MHIKKKRLELQLKQKDVSILIGVSEDTITYWEKRRAEPQIQYAPKIIQFLGYNPYQFETKTLGGRIRNYRLMNGISQKKLGKMVGVNATTVSGWEDDISVPEELNLKKLDEVLKNIVENS